MSSLKDWYRYVDSRARTRPGNEAPAARERAADQPQEREVPAGAPGGSDPDRQPAEAEAPSSDLAGADEEGLDVWSGLFSPPRKPEPKPTSAPLKRPAGRLDEVPADLPFTRTPVESPPAPQFPRPDAEISIPRFDEFVSPFVPEPAPPLVAPSAAAGPPAASGEPSVSGSTPSPSDEEAPLSPASPAGQTAPLPTATAGAPAADKDAPAASAAAGALPTDGDAADRFSAAPLAVPHPEAAAVPTGTDAPVAVSSHGPEPQPASLEGPPVPPESAAPQALADAEAMSAEEDEQVPWRSPFPRPGPGRTVSSGAPSPRPEPLVPRPAAANPPAAEPEAGTGAVLGRSPARPAPGTEAWERERVDRLARTFRETLRALEESLAGPPATPSPAPAAAEPEMPAPRSSTGADHPAAGPLSRRLDEALLSLETRTPPAAVAPASLAPGSLPASATADLDAPPAAEPAEPGEEVEASAVLPSEPVGLNSSAAPPAGALPFERLTVSDLDRAAIPAAPLETPVAATDVAVLAAAERQPQPAAPPAEALPNTPALAAERLAETSMMAEVDLTPAASLPVPPSPRPSVPTTAPPDVRRNIEEAALMRQRLPQHIDMLLRIPTNEVAQNSYKSPFRETREELIRRLLDPQLTLEEAARVLGVCPTTVRRYTNRGMLHCHRTPGNQRRFRMSDVLQFVEQYGDRIDRAAEARQFEEAA